MKIHQLCNVVGEGGDMHVDGWTSGHIDTVKLPFSIK